MWPKTSDRTERKKVSLRNYCKLKQNNLFNGFLLFFFILSFIECGYCDIHYLLFRMKVWKRRILKTPNKNKSNAWVQPMFCRVKTKWHTTLQWINWIVIYIKISLIHCLIFLGGYWYQSAHLIIFHHDWLELLIYFHPIFVWPKRMVKPVWPQKGRFNFEPTNSWSWISLIHKTTRYVILECIINAIPLIGD